jgi:hypothetical protein
MGEFCSYFISHGEHIANLTEILAFLAKPRRKRGNAIHRLIVRMSVEVLSRFPQTFRYPDRNRERSDCRQRSAVAPQVPFQIRLNFRPTTNFFVVIAACVESSPLTQRISRTEI